MLQGCEPRMTLRPGPGEAFSCFSSSSLFLHLKINLLSPLQSCINYAFWSSV